jgi:hypothetical protein
VDLLGFVRASFDDRARVSACESFTLSVAGRRIDVRSSSARLTEAVQGAMGHLATPPSGAPDLELLLFDGVDPGHIPWRRHARSVLVRGDVDHDLGPELRLSFSTESGLAQLIDRSAGLAAAWLETGGELAPWERAAPLRNLWSEWVCAQGGVLVHGAAVARGSNCLLLTGAGGSGKSTTALAAALEGWGYLGDDFLVVSFDLQGPWVASLYRSAKLGSEALHQPLLDRLATRLRLPGDGKKHCLLLGAPEIRLQHQARCSALVLPKHGSPDAPGRASDRTSRSKGRYTATWHAAPPTEVQRALAPSSLFLTAGPHGPRFQRLAALARSVPGWELDLSRDHATNVAQLGDLLAESASAPHGALPGEGRSAGMHPPGRGSAELPLE